MQFGAKGLNDFCPKASRIEFLPVALSNSKVPHYHLRLKYSRPRTTEICPNTAHVTIIIFMQK